jgi:phosphonate transport system substrate-binding protein
MKIILKLVASLVLLALSLFGCNQTPQNQEPKYDNSPVRQNDAVYSFAVHPLHNPQKLNQAYQPLIDYINKQLKGAKLELEASRDYGSFEEKIRAKSPHFLLPNPWQTLQGMKNGYQVVAMAGDPQDFKGIFVVRRDSGIAKPSNLKGKAVSYPSPTALAACIMPQYFLHQHGINVNKDIVNRYVGSQESSIMNAYLGQTAAGATWPPPWRAFQKDHPKEALEMKVIWETPHLINNSVMVRDDVPPQLRDQIRTALIKLRETPEGTAILAGMETARFHSATDVDYEVVTRYVARFEKEVRPVEQK